MKERRYDIDWLRVVATLAVFVLHCTRFYDPFPWHLKNAQQSDMLTPLVGFLDLWMMPLLFLLSGFGSWYSLKSRTGGRYLLERVVRLLIPLYTVGALVLLPPQFYFELFTNEGYTGTFWEMLPRYVDILGLRAWRVPKAAMGLTIRLRLYDRHDPQNLFPLRPWSGHLWFLPYLFLVSLVALPLLFYLRSERGQRWIERLAGWSERRGGIFLFLIPLVLVRIALRGFFRGEHTWADFVYYAVFFLIGYLIPADVRFTESVKRHGWLCLALGIAGWMGEAALILGLGYPYPGAESFSWIYVLFQIVMGIANWSWVVFIMSLGAKYLNFNNKVLAYGGEMVLPFYILHQTIILLVGWYVIPLNLPIVLKYLIITPISFVLVIALYELLVKRVNAIRFLFGMRLKKKPPAAPTPRPEGTAA